MDILFSLVFDPRLGANERWSEAIDKGIKKEIKKSILIDICSDEVSEEYKANGTVKTRADLCLAIGNGTYEIPAPHTAEIPKPNGEKRIVYVNTGIVRVFLAVVNRLLFELCSDMVHPTCKSYQRGIGCGNVVSEISDYVEQHAGVIGIKSDLRHYFDEVPLKYIEQCFDEIEKRIGHSKIIDVLRNYYRSDLYYVLNTGVEAHKYQSLKQGCAVASFLADAILYPMDKRLAELPGLFKYIRYCDDQLVLIEDYDNALEIIKEELSKFELTINEKKLEYIDRDHYFKFLGFSIKGASRSFSDTTIKTFQKDVKRLILDRDVKNYDQARRKIIKHLYVGDGEHSWALRLFSVVNNDHDIRVMNNYLMDALRAKITGKTRIAGLGYVKNQKDGCVARGTGRNVKKNREKTDKWLKGYYSMKCMQNLLRTDREMYNVYVREMMTA